MHYMWPFYIHIKSCYDTFLRGNSGWDPGSVARIFAVSLLWSMYSQKPSFPLRTGTRKCDNVYYWEIRVQYIGVYIQPDMVRNHFMPWYMDRIPLGTFGAFSINMRHSLYMHPLGTRRSDCFEFYNRNPYNLSFTLYFRYPTRRSQWDYSGWRLSIFTFFIDNIYGDQNTGTRAL